MLSIFLLGDHRAIVSCCGKELVTDTERMRALVTPYYTSVVTAMQRQAWGAVVVGGQGQLLAQVLRIV